jgi:predicted secreted hydrolase
MPFALLDTTLLSNFAQVRRPDLLRTALGPDAATTSAILSELHAGKGGIAIDLPLRSIRPVVLNGGGGYSRKGPEPGNASIIYSVLSCYYSLTRIATASTAVVDGRFYAVHGLSWMDHEFSSSALGPERPAGDPLRR